MHSQCNFQIFHLNTLHITINIFTVLGMLSYIILHNSSQKVSWFEIKIVTKILRDMNIS